ncbi:hypothetical protein T484DRAFT_1923549 [Baffinella frigidus]|nr:hypothetical protein T484DRAFT_1923549 [Cryptophyta sp. CCMP2293]
MAPRMHRGSLCLVGVAALLLLAATANGEEESGAAPAYDACLFNCDFKHAGTDADPCQPASGAGTEADPYVFETYVNFFQSSTGYYMFTKCGPTPKPTLQIKAGAYYKFDQQETTNHMHPLGFAYFPDGAHEEKDELEPSVTPPGSSSKCAADASCQAPRYMSGTEGTIFLGGNGLLSTDADPYVGKGDGGWGLDVYEPDFEGYYARWTFNKWNVRVQITDDATAEMFYFCHIHNKMSGRIIVTNADGSPRSAAKATLYPPIVVNAADEQCGTSPFADYGDSLGPSAFGMDSGKCETSALCGEMNTFRKCNEAIDCHMSYNMRITHSTDPVITFMRQMIPHHQNAVNMAKILLRTYPTKLTAADDELGEDKFIRTMLYNVINGQNHQIMQMHGYLKSHESQVYDESCATLLEVNQNLAWLWAFIGLAVGALAFFAIWFFVLRKRAGGAYAAPSQQPLPEGAKLVYPASAEQPPGNKV